MTMEITLVLACAAAVAMLLGAAGLILVSAQKKRCNEAQEAAEASIFHVKKECVTRTDELKSELQTEFRQALESLETGLRGPERAIAGAMSRSNRAEALKLLRSGMAPETAASTLGIPKNDVLLLSKVVNVLAAQ